MVDNVDLAYHALPYPGGSLRFDHFADKLMPKNARVRIISFDQFKICAANARFANFD
jgi:hypothetical protein